MFGGTAGVVRTKVLYLHCSDILDCLLRQVGYTGGTTNSPTYRSMGDHTETVEVGLQLELVCIFSSA